MKIEICGGIASGKTTLALLLKRAGYFPILEDFQSNPFWQLFYSDPDRFAFETEITFLLQHYNLIKQSTVGTGDKAYDFSLLLDRTYADVTLDAKQLSVFNAVYIHAFDELGPPNLVIHLECTANEELRRIRNRQRTVEQGIQLKYLKEINDALERRVKEASVEFKIIHLNSNNLNFAEVEEDKVQVIELIENSL